MSRRNLEHTSAHGYLRAIREGSNNQYQTMLADYTEKYFVGLTK